MYNFTILSYWKIEKCPIFAVWMCMLLLHTMPPYYIYIYLVYTCPQLYPLFDIPREYIWKKNHQIYLSLYLANLLFFSFVRLCTLSVLIFHTYIIFKIRFGGPTTKYTKQFLHSGKKSTVFCLIPKEKKPYIWNIVYFWLLIF